MLGHKATRQERTLEVAEFLGVSYYDANVRLSEGFGFNNARVTEDFRRANPQGDAALLDWYRQTDAYIWELTAYHLDLGFNYTGMIEGIAQHLSRDITEDNQIVSKRVLCLGDGIGDLTFCLRAYGHAPVYHDLLGSQTFRFAEFRMSRWLPCSTLGTADWSPPVLTEPFDAVIALDFMEHVTDVEEWTRFVYRTLKSEGQFLAQNAFAQGDEEHGGSLPMHLSRNNKYAEADPDPAAGGRALWDSLLLNIGFKRDGGWWIK